MDDNLSTRQFGMAQPLSWHGQFLRRLGAEKGIYNPMEGGRVEEIPLTHGLRAMQSEVEPKRMAHYGGATKSGRPRQSGTHLGEEKGVGIPIVYRVNNEHVVFNGHHRIAQAISRGQKTGFVRVHDLGNIDPNDITLPP